MEPFAFPTTMVDSFELIADGEVIARIKNNYRRLVKISVNRTVTTLTLRISSTTGAESAHIFSFDFK